MITDNEVKSILSSGTIAVTGETYYLPTDKEIDDFLQSPSVGSFVASFEWKRSVSDCSWAAWGFVNLFVGMGWAVSYEVLKGHALVRIINDQKDEVWIEPQTGQRTKNERKLILTVMP